MKAETKVVWALIVLCVAALVGGSIAGLDGEVMKYLLLPILGLFWFQVIDWSYGAPKKESEAETQAPATDVGQRLAGIASSDRRNSA